MTRKRKVVYPPSRSSKGAPPPRAPQVTPATVATINTQAGIGRAGIVPGMRVVIQGTGLYAGETVVVQSLVPGVIAAAVVKTDAGQTRRVRTVDLVAGPEGHRRAGRSRADRSRTDASRGTAPARGVAVARPSPALRWPRYGFARRAGAARGVYTHVPTRARHLPPGRVRSYPGDGGRPVWPVHVAPDPDGSPSSRAPCSRSSPSPVAASPPRKMRGASSRSTWCTTTSRTRRSPARSSARVRRSRTARRSAPPRPPTTRTST